MRKLGPIQVAEQHRQQGLQCVRGAFQAQVAVASRPRSTQVEAEIVGEFDRPACVLQGETGRFGLGLAGRAMTALLQGQLVQRQRFTEVELQQQRRVAGANGREEGPVCAQFLVAQQAVPDQHALHFIRQQVAGRARFQLAQGFKFVGVKAEQLDRAHLQAGIGKPGHA
ncbi:hypothetical protein G6F57_013850 [Rhizopus arrhizus]|nr:hypothetical protein G6F24_016286 [Rhizopus arrhizus]KAG1462927.1 hypothetical protein G6F57_013850 [Rhizopus arrhizus]